MLNEKIQRSNVKDGFPIAPEADGNDKRESRILLLDPETSSG